VTLVLALAATLLVGGSPAWATDASASLSGRLVDTNGSPVEGFTVSLVAPGESGGWTYAKPRTVSDAEGRFHLTDVVPGSYRLEARDPYYPGRFPATTWPAAHTVEEGSTFSLAAGEARLSMDLTFQRFGDVDVESTFRGERVDVATFLERRVLVGGDITWLPWKDNSRGRVGEVAPGTYRVRQVPDRPDNGQDTYVPGVTDPAEATQFEVQPDATATLRNVIAESPRLRVKIHDATGSPVPRASFVAQHHGRGSESYTANASGEISAAVRPGRYSFWVHAPEGSGLAGRPLGDAEITPDGGHDVDVTLQRSATLVGTVKHPRGAKVAGVDVRLDLRVGEEWIETRALNGVFGRFSFYGLTPGRYRWRIENPLLEPSASGELELGVAQRLEHDFTVDVPAGMTLTIRPQGAEPHATDRLVTELLSSDGTVVASRTGEAKPSFRTEPGGYRVRVRDPRGELATTYVLSQGVDDATYFELQSGHESSFEVAPAPVTALRSTKAPEVEGHLVVGQVLGSTRGEWAGTPTSFADEWLVDGTVVPRANQVSFKVPPEALGREISTRVTARNDRGETITQTSLPVGPVTLGKPGNLTVEPRLEGVDLRWSSVSYADAYELRHRSAGASAWTVQRIPAQAPTASRSPSASLSLETDTAYEVQVVAIRSGVPAATSSTEVRSFRTTSAVPAAVSGLSAKARSTSVLDLAWTRSPGAVRYRVEAVHDGERHSVAEVTGTSATVRQLPAGTRATVFVTAVNRRGESAGLARVVRSTLAVTPARPRLAARSTTALRVKVGRTAGATSYRLELLRGGRVLTSVVSRSGEARITRLRPRTGYVVVARALNADGQPTSRSTGLRVSTR
jgi:protocatechuate 3,4-dioxygenase beta subunit